MKKKIGGLLLVAFMSVSAFGIAVPSADAGPITPGGQSTQPDNRECEKAESMKRMLAWEEDALWSDFRSGRISKSDLKKKLKGLEGLQSFWEAQARMHCLPDIGAVDLPEIPGLG